MAAPLDSPHRRAALRYAARRGSPQRNAFNTGGTDEIIRDTGATCRHAARRCASQRAASLRVTALRHVPRFNASLGLIRHTAVSLRSAAQRGSAHRVTTPYSTARRIVPRCTSSPRIATPLIHDKETP